MFTPSFKTLLRAFITVPDSEQHMLSDGQESGIRGWGKVCSICRSNGWAGREEKGPENEEEREELWGRGRVMGSPLTWTEH